MTDGDRQLADIALRIIKSDMERTGGSVPVVVVREATGKIIQIPFPESAAQLMNSGRGKDAIFGFIRAAVRFCGYTAVVIATEAWVAKPTATGLALPQEEYIRYGSEPGFKTGVELGYMERVEAVVASIQTPDGVLLIQQQFERDDEARRITFGERDEVELGVDDFRGRQKMYGDLREEWLR